MYKILLIALLLLPVISKAQGKIVINDTTLAIGIVKTYSYASRNLSNCINSDDKLLDEGAKVIISGINNCPSVNTTNVYKYFEILFDNEKYYIEPDKLHVLEGTYEGIEKLDSEGKEKFRAKASSISEALRLNNLGKVLKFTEKSKSKGICVLKWDIADESEYTDGTSVSFEVFNPTQKTVKYIWFTVIGYNAVGDKVIDRRRGTSAITLKGIGPIRPNASADYTFEYAWFTDLVDDAKISSIKVQYMDGSVKLISDPKSIIMPSEYYEILQNSN